MATRQELAIMPPAGNNGSVQILAGSLALSLTPLEPRFVPQVFAVYGDEHTWAHLPEGRYQKVQQAEELVSSAVRSWEDAGLGPWAILTSGPNDSEAFVGVGGLNRLCVPAWNLGYRLDPLWWGNGIATAVARAAIASACELGTPLPITARVLANNPASERVLRTVGLEFRWEGARAGAQDEAALSRIYSDREVPEDVFEWLRRNA
jgi:RimJ/RimL family protein N-acetyltransferase